MNYNKHVPIQLCIPSYYNIVLHKVRQTSSPRPDEESKVLRLGLVTTAAQGLLDDETEWLSGVDNNITTIHANMRALKTVRRIAFLLVCRGRLFIIGSDLIQLGTFLSS